MSPAISLHAAYTAWLWVAAALVLLAIAFAHRARRHSLRWRMTCLLLPALAATLTALAAANLAATYAPRAASVTLLIDLSASARTSPWQNPAWLRELARTHLPPNTRVNVLAFATGTQPLIQNAPLDSPDLWPAAWPTLPDAPTTLPPLPPNSPTWLITDACFPAPISTFHPGAVTLIHPADPDVAITQIHLESHTLWMQVRATAATSARFALTRNDAPLAQQLLRFAADESRWLSIEIPAPSAAQHQPITYHATITRQPSADPWPENDSATLLDLPDQTPRVLIVTASPPPAPITQATTDMFTRRITAEQFALEPARWIREGYQTVLLINEPDSPQLNTALDLFVRKTAGGLVIVNPRAMPDFAALSPLTQLRTDRPPANIIFLLDASASMNESAGVSPEKKFLLAARDVEQAIDLLQPTDRITLLAFNNTTQTIAAGTKAGLAPTLHANLTAISPAGPTNPDSALPSLRTALAAPAQTNLVIFLTDGDVPAISPTAWHDALSNAHLTIVAPAAAQSGTLGKLAAPNVAFLPSGQPNDWPTLLRQAIATPFLGHSHTDPLTWQASTPPLTGQTSHWLESWKTPAAADLATADTRTLAAIAPRGLGHAAAFAMLDDTPAFTTLLEHTLRTVAANPGDRRFILAANPAPDGWLLTADGIDPTSSTFLNGESLAARTVGSDQPIPLTQTAPGHYEARLAALSIAPLAITITRNNGADLVGLLRAPALATTEYPATVEPRADFPQSIHIDPSSATLWQPRQPIFEIALAPYLFSTGALIALAALVLRLRSAAVLAAAKS